MPARSANAQASAIPASASRPGRCHGAGSSIGTSSPRLRHSSHREIAAIRKPLV
jgi:hypothetical protein